MASPVAHSFAGFWTFLVFAERAKIRLRDQWRRYVGHLCLLVCVANLPDLDFIPELLFHKDYHRGFSHSLLAAILASFVLTWIWKITGTFWSSFGIYFAAYGSHLVIDFFTGMQLGWNHSGSGIPLFWPWPGNDLSSQLILIYGVTHGSMSAMFSVANLRAVCYDFVFFGSITTGILLWRTRYILNNQNISQPPKVGAHQPEYQAAHRE
jgi:inner membrane protein